MSRETIHPAAHDEETLWRESDVRRVRRSGPGGQHRNKVESGIVLLHRSTGISAEASERRSQADNRRVALRRLRINLALDVRSDESVRTFFDQASAALGPIDILVNAAGMNAPDHMASHSDEKWHRVIDTNLNGNYRTIRRCLEGMMERGWGRIVVIASTAAAVGMPTHAAYCASKSGLLGLMRCVALEGAPRGVTCNAISPGHVDTPLAETAFRHAVERGESPSVEAIRAEAMKSCPQGRFIEPEDVGSLVVYLCGDAAGRITMEDLRIAGGALW